MTTADNRSNRLPLLLFLILFFSFFFFPVCPLYSGQDSNMPSDAELEIFSRDYGYAGGRQAADEKDGQRNLSALSIKGDKEFRKRLESQGLKFINAVDDPKTGMQVTLVETAEGKPVLIFRGTEFHIGTDGERKRDAGADIDPRGIGYGQYDANKEKIKEMIKGYEEQGKKITVTGHSLGGALAQRFIADNPENVDKAVLFNSPGIDAKTAGTVDPENLPDITYYKNPDDVVSELSPGGHLKGKVYTVAGGKTDTANVGSVVAAEHRGTMLQEDSGTTVTEDKFDRWQENRKTDFVKGLAKDQFKIGKSIPSSLVKTVVNKGLGGDEVIKAGIEAADEVLYKPQDAQTAAQDAIDNNKIKLLDKIDAGEIILTTGVSNRQFVDAYQQFIKNPTRVNREKFRNMYTKKASAPAVGSSQTAAGQQVASIASDIEAGMNFLEEFLFGNDTSVSGPQEDDSTDGAIPEPKIEPEVPKEKTGPVTDDENLPNCDDVQDGTRCRDTTKVSGETYDPDDVCGKPCPEGQTRNCGRIKSVGESWQYIDLGCIEAERDENLEPLEEQDIEKEAWELEWEKNYQAYHDELDRLAEEKKKEREKDWEDWKKYGYQGPDIDILAGPEWRQLGWGEYLAMNKDLRIAMANLYHFMMTKKRVIEQMQKKLVDCSQGAREIRQLPPDATSWSKYHSKLTQGYALLRLNASSTVGGDAMMDSYWPELAYGPYKAYMSMLIPSMENVVKSYKSRVVKDKADLLKMKGNSKYLQAVMEYNQWYDKKAAWIRVINDNMSIILDRHMWTTQSSPEPIRKIEGESNGCVAVLHFVEAIEVLEEKIKDLKAWIDKDTQRVDGLLKPVRQRLSEYDTEKGVFVSKPNSFGQQSQGVGDGGATLDGKQFTKSETEKKLDNITLQLFKIRQMVLTPYEGAVSDKSVQMVTKALFELRGISKQRMDRLIGLAAASQKDMANQQSGGGTGQAPGSSKATGRPMMMADSGGMIAVNTASRPWRLLKTVIVPQGQQVYLGNDSNGINLLPDLMKPAGDVSESSAEAPSSNPPGNRSMNILPLFQQTGKYYITADSSGNDGLIEIVSGAIIYYGNDLSGQEITVPESGRLFVWGGIPQTLSGDPALRVSNLPKQVTAGLTPKNQAEQIAFDWLKNVTGDDTILNNLNSAGFHRLLVKTINFEINYLDKEILRGLSVKDSNLKQKVTSLRSRLSGIQNLLESLRRAPTLSDFAMGTKPAFRPEFTGIKDVGRLDFLGQMLVSWERNADSHVQRLANFQKIEALYAEASALQGSISAISDLDLIVMEFDELVKKDKFNHDYHYASEVKEMSEGFKKIRLQLLTEQVKKMYADFVTTYESRDAYALVTFLASDWQANDGTTIDDMEEILQNSFDLFDEVNMKITSLNIRPIYEDYVDHNFKFEVVYSSQVRGVIYDNDIQHNEEASITDTVIMTSEGPKILKTGGGGFWMR